MKIVYFVRHAQTTTNVQQVLAGSRNDTPLTDTGRKQAHELAIALRGIQFDIVCSSPLKRAFDTAVIIANDIGYSEPIVQSALLIERDFGEATGKSREQISDTINNGTVQGLESIEDFAARANKALAWLALQPGKTLLVVSHGGFGQMFGTVLAGKSPESFREYRHLDNTEFYTLTIGN